MPCNASYTRFIFEGFSYVLQIDMHFICTPMWTKFYSCEKWVLQLLTAQPVFQATADEPNTDTNANAAPPIPDATTTVPDAPLQ
jgi:hypothetical protein